MCPTSHRTLASTQLATLRVVFGQGACGATTIPLRMALLRGEPAEEIFTQVEQAPITPPRPALSGEKIECFETSERDLIGCVRAPIVAEKLVEQSQALYEHVLRLGAGREFYRIWNYVPRINESDTRGLENYRAFCLGRAQAFESVWGAGFERRLPAGSAVGGPEGELVILFVAGQAAVQHFENPDQVPAYEYPVEHGPRSPSFARATVVGDRAQPRAVFVSGTAAIKGHHSITDGGLSGQIACTLDNLKLISRASGLGDDLGAGAGAWQRHFKIYLRRAEDLAATEAALKTHLLRPGDRPTYLLSDICRRELDVEIEATLVRR